MVSKLRKIASSVNVFVFQSKTFCCCVPVRIGFIIMSFLSILVSALLSIVIWYEVATTQQTYDSHERPAFIVAGLFETLLFIASILGFTGAMARKQLFVTIYAYFIYVHFVINVVVATYFLFVISDAVKTDVLDACQQGLHNVGSEAQCADLLKIGRNIYIGVSLSLLVIEFYSALVVSRYVHQLKTEKRTVRQSRLMGSGSGFDFSGKRGHYPSASADHIGLLGGHSQFSGETGEYDPYAESVTPNYRYGDPAYSTPYDDPSSVGYTGGRHTYEEIPAEQRELMRQRGDDEEENLELAELRSRSTTGDAGVISNNRRNREIPVLPPHSYSHDTTV